MAHYLAAILQPWRLVGPVTTPARSLDTTTPQLFLHAPVRAWDLAPDGRPQPRWMTAR